jgi:YHS domain-containing protein
MSDINENCAVCGKDLAKTSGVAHLYHDGKSFPLCCPLCVDLFQRAPARFAKGERPQTVVEELLSDIKWKETGRY